MAKKKEEVNLSEIDASFVISSFKNKERRNNPSSIPRPLLPPDKEKKPESEPEIPMVVQPEAPREESKRKRNKLPDYESLFLTDADIPTRSGKLVSIREKYHKRIAKVVKALDKKDVSIFSYIDNVLSHHFDMYQDEIKEIYNKDKEDDDYLTP